jgi:hypothetical protein
MIRPAVLLAVLPAALVPLALPVVAAADAPPTGRKVDIVFHVMSKCPYAIRAEETIGDVVGQLGDRARFRLEFVGDERQPGVLTSMHGDGEVEGDLLELCTARLAPKRLFALLACLNRDLQAIPGNFDACAAEAKVPAAAVRACANGSQGRRLLSDSFRASAAAGARGSPTMYFGGVQYQGNRSAQSFLRAACGHLSAPLPPACASLPPVTRVPVVVLTDSRCKDCDHARRLASLRAIVEDLDEKVVDCATPEGRKVYDALRPQGLERLPAYLFRPEVKATADHERLARQLRTVGPWEVLDAGAKWDPTLEVCDNGIDDDGNAKVDCDDPGCGGSLACRKETPATLDVFVMSLCPFAVKGEVAFAAIAPDFPEVRFAIHYIADEKGDGRFDALHGQPEVDENKRQLCAMKHYPKDGAWLDYILCRNAAIRSADWQACATGPIKAAVIAKCAEGPEGTKLLATDIAEARSLGIQASPTWLVNNRQFERGISRDQLRDMICKHNPTLKGCDKVYEPLEAGDPAPVGGCGGR